MFYAKSGQPPDPGCRSSAHAARLAPGAARRTSAGLGVRTDSPLLRRAVLTVDRWEVDIECTVGPPGLCATSVETMLDRARHQVEPFGFTHLQPDLHDHVLVLVVNAFKDGLDGSFSTPWSVEDLRRIVRRDEFQPQSLVSRASEGRVLSALWIVADWLSENAAAPEWRHIRDRIGSRPPSARVARVYGWLRSQGWPTRSGLLVAATSSDVAWRSVGGLALTTVGVPVVT